ncbi:MAG: ADP-ribosylglycohydrolase family protein, partial [Clostridia bacterium]|nr:ADP-ribosylglycohydrolase family protein [Clostridia bacterium]
AGYGIRFANWLFLDGREPYNSLGNGSAMRVSPVAWAFDDIDIVRKAAVAVTIPTHNHPEGVKGAEATASAIFLARKGRSKAEIKDYIEKEFGYDLSRTCDEIRPAYRHDETCMRTVPEAITAFLEGESFEDVIRTAVSLGGDSDTLTAIAGSIAEGFYGISDELKCQAIDRLDGPLRIVLCKFDIMLNGCPEPDVTILNDLAL